MAVTRNRQNLRGYGLAQDPTAKIDYGFVDDQNRRQSQDKSIDAANERQQASFDQRDKETKIGLLGKLPQIKSNWSPSAKKILSDQMEGFVKGADGMSMEDTILGLNEINTKVSAYEDIGNKLAKAASGVLSGDVYAGEIGESLISGKYDEEFQGKDFEEIIANGSGILQSQFAAVPSQDDWNGLIKRGEEVAKQGKPRLERTGTMMYGKEIVNEVYDVDPALNEAILGNFVNDNQNYFRLNPNALEGYRNQLTDNVRGNSFQDTPRVRGNGGDNQEDLEIAREVKENVNKFQDSFKGYVKDGESIDEEFINQYVAPYGLDVSVQEDGDMVFFRGDKPVSGRIKPNDAESMYNLIAKYNPHIKRKSIDKVSFDDPTKGEIAPEKKKEVKAKIDGIISGKGTQDDINKSIESLGGKVVDYGAFGGAINNKPTKIEVDGKTFDMTDDEEAKEAYIKLEEKGLSNGSSEESKNKYGL